ncbi:hypothetical protein APR04_005427 [Promicromonospora umidemergens]|uniref:hypothetical protein n=1 Tax=Promicromonospora umidemergens TaxID=629679 RepID=UPI0020A2D9AB|nr:hypothetical protein [Promicromonospora umidemergens]MCP2286490.1 hypothetical protein [Promicromonospora umidemergens]
MERFTRCGAVLLLVLGLAVAPAAMAPAAAHGGKIDIELGTDGGGGVSAAVTWAGDGHPVEESAIVVVRAVSDTGEEVGPVTLVSASEGVGWYRSEPALLDEGHWTVTARVTEPRKAKVEVEIDVVPPPSAPPSEPASAGPDTAEITTEAGAAGLAATDDGSSSGLPGSWTGWALGALVVAAGVAAVVVLRRRTA